MKKEIILSPIWEIPFAAISIQSETGEAMANVVIDAGGSVAVCYANSDAEEDLANRGAVCEAIIRLTDYYAAKGGLLERKDNLLRVTQALADTITRDSRAGTSAP